ncbi:MAG: DUF1768 domain-containing protein [Clostridia bacterium]|nr:DUF1768 domain-containing protein [Clostridia bacterium]
MDREKRRVIVLGGSFNPPTLAHLQLLRQALDAMDARLGVFLPTSRAYLTRKMRRAGGIHMRLTEGQRYDMLMAMCAEDARLTVSDMEYGTVSPATVGLMTEMKAQYPEDELYFLIGADKLSMVAGWFADPERIPCFRLLVVCRDGVDADAFLDADERTARNRDAFVTLHIEGGLEEISSTRVRAMMRGGQPLAGLVHPDVERMLQGQTFFEEIVRFKGEYDFLAMGYPAPVQLDGEIYASAEAAYAAARCADRKDRARFHTEKRERIAAIAARIAQREDWETVRDGVLEEILRDKFTRSPELAKRLLATGDIRLVAGGMKNLFLGEDLYTCEGENRLGIALMKLRDEFRQTI